MKIPKQITIAVLFLMTTSFMSAAIITDWTFTTGTTTPERLTPSNTSTGASVSSLTINSAVQDFGVNAVPSGDNDGMGFGGTGSGNQVIFWHRANFFNSDGVGTTTWGVPGSDGIDTTVSTAPMSFTVSADTGYDVTIDSISVDSENAGYLLFFQEAGQAAGPESGGATAFTTASLNSSVTINSGSSKTFTLNWNSGALNSFFNVNEISLNGSVTAVPEPSTYAMLSGFAVLGLVLARRRFKRW